MEGIAGNKKKRTSIKIRDKIKVLNAIRDEPGTSLSSIAKRFGFAKSTVHQWKQAAEKIRAVTNNKVRNSYHLQHPCKPMFPKIDQAVTEWFNLRTLNGLVVKDKYLQARAQHEREMIMNSPDEHGDIDFEKLEQFSGSNMWLKNFKKRSDLVSRRHTSTHKLPENFRAVCIGFHKFFHKLIRDHNIKRKDIVNIDQVPRYFEMNQGSTLAKKGTRQVFFRKSASGHKRFTYTPAIDGDGKIIAQHILLSKLINIPKEYNRKCMVSVNNSGMWNDIILEQFVERIIRIKRSMFVKNSILIALDSYATHISWVNANKRRYEERQVFFAIIPPRMTPLLQPLDVQVNRPFQQFFNDKSQAYMQETVNDDSYSTVHGGTKMPSTLAISNWVSEWSAGVDKELVRSAFDVTGLVPEEEFEIDRLHTPLKAIYEQSFQLEDWFATYGSFMQGAEVIFTDDMSIFQYAQKEPKNQKIGFEERKFPFFRAIHFAIDSEEAFVSWHKNILLEIEQFLTTSEVTKPIVELTDIEVIKRGSSLSFGRLEVYAISTLLQRTIHLLCINQKMQVTSKLTFGEQFDGEDLGFFYSKDPFIVVYDPTLDLEAYVETVVQRRKDNTLGGPSQEQNSANSDSAPEAPARSDFEEDEVIFVGGETGNVNGDEVQENMNIEYVFEEDDVYGDEEEREYMDNEDREYMDYEEHEYMDYEEHEYMENEKHEYMDNEDREYMDNEDHESTQLSKEMSKRASRVVTKQPGASTSSNKAFKAMSQQPGANAGSNKAFKAMSQQPGVSSSFNKAFKDTDLSLLNANTGGIKESVIVDEDEEGSFKMVIAQDDMIYKLRPNGTFSRAFQ